MNIELSKIIEIAYQDSIDQSDFTTTINLLSTYFSAPEVIFGSNLEGQEGGMSNAENYNNIETTKTPQNNRKITYDPITEIVFQKNDHANTTNHIAASGILNNYPQAKSCYSGIVDHSMAFATLYESNCRYHLFYIGRPPAQEAFSDTETLNYSLIAPHVMRALRIKSELKYARTLKSTHLDALPHPTILVTADGIIVGINRLAADFSSDFLNAHTLGPVQRGARLSAIKPTLEGLGHDEIKVVTTLFQLPSDTMIAILSGAPASWTGGEKELYAICFYDFNIARTAPAALLKSQYGLSEPETKLLINFLNFRSINAAANACSVKPSSARKYIKGVFEKVGVHSQAELVHVMLTHPFAETKYD